MKASIQAAIEVFDGQHTGVLKQAFGGSIEAQDIDDLIDLSNEPDENSQIAATWLIKFALEQVHEITQQQLETYLNDLGRLDHWGARLHVAQTIPLIDLPEQTIAGTYRWLEQNASHTQKFVRAWSLYSLALVATSHDVRQDEALALISKTEAHEQAASVRSRLKKALALFDK